MTKIHIFYSLINATLNFPGLKGEKAEISSELVLPFNFKAFTSELGIYNMTKSTLQGLLDYTESEDVQIDYMSFEVDGVIYPDFQELSYNYKAEVDSWETEGAKSESNYYFKDFFEAQEFVKRIVKTPGTAEQFKSIVLCHIAPLRDVPRSENNTVTSPLCTWVAEEAPEMHGTFIIQL